MSHFHPCRVWLWALIAAILPALEVTNASASCPDVSASYSARLDLSVSKGIKSADSSCVEGAPNGGACNSFVGMIIDKTYGFPDLKTNHGYLSAAGISAYLPTSEAWTELGFAGEQTVLNQSQTDANNGVPVIALSDNQVALIIPSPKLVHTRELESLRTDVRGALLKGSECELHLRSAIVVVALNLRGDDLGARRARRRALLAEVDRLTI